MQEPLKLRDSLHKAIGKTMMLFNIVEFIRHYTKAEFYALLDSLCQIKIYIYELNIMAVFLSCIVKGAV